MEDPVLGEILKALAPYGLPGILLALVGWLYHLKDKALQLEQLERKKDVEREMTARIEDAKKFHELAMSLQKEVINAVNKLSDIVEIWEKREEERERDERAERAASRGRAV